MVVIALAGTWQVFIKAGREGWEAIIPLYNIYVMTQIAGQPWWLVIFCLIPFVNVLALGVLCWKLAECFGYSWPFALGLIFLPFVFYPLLGFGDAKYTPPAIQMRFMS
jgi:hypothetical protein